MNKTKTMLLASAMLLAAPAWAQESERNIWPDKRPAEVVLKKGKMKQEMGDDDILRIQQMPVPTLQKFPVVKSPKGKVVVICPGGGYQILAVNHEGTEIAQWLNALGYTAYVLRYRVPDNREGALQDVQRAIRIARAENPGKQVGVMGFSAGASLTARAATRFQLPSYTATDETDTQSARPDFAALIYPAYMDEGEHHTLTPELTITEQTPPFFVFQTADDPYGNSALVISQALRNHKIPVQLHIYEKGGHGYGLRANLAEAASKWPKLMEEWLLGL
ncbi:MAG: alpha/beta hydrolase [Bacteroidaceae bacterium]|nr:alpha/beta hydrolase [Prevotellaceae bacterium]MDD7658774.1 alpha/beta hydrolase [Prevotellaceae bacterium]MDY5598777.1 alpha/beta hydrolase [Bacteroidaceae bacterium]